MAGKSDYLEQMVLDAVFRTQAAYKPAAIYVGLFSVNPAANPETTGTELTGNGYARVQVTQADVSWTKSGTNPSQVANAAAITFPAATGSNWASITGFGIFDAVTGGNLLYWGTYAGGVCAVGTVASFAIGALVITED